MNGERTLPSSFPAAWAHLISQKASHCFWKTSHLEGGTVPASQGLRSAPALAYWFFFPKQKLSPRFPAPAGCALCWGEGEAPPAHGACGPCLPCQHPRTSQSGAGAFQGRAERCQTTGWGEDSVCRNSAALGQIASVTNDFRITHIWNYQQVTPQELTNPSAQPCTGLGCSWGLFML